MKTSFKVRYIGEDDADIRRGDVCDAEELIDCTTMYGVRDRSGEVYAYPKTLFEVVTE